MLFMLLDNDLNWLSYLLIISTLNQHIPLQAVVLASY